MLKNRTISSILRYCKTKPRFLDIVTKTALFQNRTNQGRVIPRPYCSTKLFPLDFPLYAVILSLCLCCEAEEAFVPMEEIIIAVRVLIVVVVKPIVV